MLCEMRGILALVGVAVIPATEGYVNGYAPRDGGVGVPQVTEPNWIGGVSSR